MDTQSTYRDDVYAWSQEQAAVLRDMGRQPGLPNRLDLSNVAEEIESVGSEARHAVESFLRLMLVHLIKVAISPHVASRGHWRAEILNFQAELLGRYSRSMRQDIDLDLLWQRAGRQAAASLAEYGEPVPAELPKTCPVTLDGLLHEPLDLAEMIDRIGRSSTPS